MNRYPWWKYTILAIALLVGLVYTLPNFFGEAPAVQVSSAKATLKVDSALVPRIEQALQQAGASADFVQFEGTSVKARFSDTDTQLKAKDAIGRAQDRREAQIDQFDTREAQRDVAVHHHAFGQQVVEQIQYRRVTGLQDLVGHRRVPCPFARTRHHQSCTKEYGGHGPVRVSP